jgi:hypothetical protein
MEKHRSLMGELISPTRMRRGAITTLCCFLDVVSGCRMELRQDSAGRWIARGQNQSRSAAPLARDKDLIGHKPRAILWRSRKRITGSRAPHAQYTPRRYQCRMSHRRISHRQIRR